MTPARFQVTREEFREGLIDAIQEAIHFDEIGKFLPFQTRVVMGETMNHIQSTSVFAIKTENRLVKDGDTLCGRKAPVIWEGDRNHPNCPGCEAIGKGLAVRDLL
jgi:hypothetical protein